MPLLPQLLEQPCGALALLVGLSELEIRVSDRRGIPDEA